MSNAKIENLENHLVRVTVNVTADKFEEAISAAYNENKSKISVPGFRKGKVPRQLVEKTYGKEYFYEDAINHVFPEVYENALTENNITPVSRPTLEKPVITETEVTISAVVFKKPEIVVENYKGVEVEKTDAVATDEDVMNEIKKELDKNSRLVSKTEGAVENGDVCKIDFAGFVDGEAFEGGQATDYSLEIGSKSFIDTFEDQLMGAKIGEELDVNVTFPAGYHSETLSGKPALFKVTVKEVSKKEYPELDDEFAATVSEFETLDAYKADLLEKLKVSKKQAAEQEKENKVIRKLIETADLDVPAIMIENRVSQMVQDFSMQIEQNGMKLEDYLGFMGQTMESLREVYTPEAKIQVHARLILEYIGKTEKFDIADEDLDAEIERIASMYGMEFEQLKSVMRPEDKEGILDDIRTQKALKFIVDNAKEV